MQFMNRGNVLNLRSFWQIQIVGWCCFYLFDLLESIHNFLTRRVSIADQTVPIFFMFLGSCALRPFCRRLLRQSQSCLRSLPYFGILRARTLARFGYSLGVVFFYALHVVQSVLQY
jgi:hypothetical protein